ncbi:hypothetical protein Pelo_12961 [Pelomyxa schiedti]|nr:hypothetical protein Pelo_12961 [Pelomyxa schiedti]
MKVKHLRPAVWLFGDGSTQGRSLSPTDGWGVVLFIDKSRYEGVWRDGNWTRGTSLAALNQVLYQKHAAQQHEDDDSTMKFNARS